MHLLSRKEIDDDSWNSFIKNSKQRNIYALSWFMDSIPQEWKALVKFDTQGNIIAAIPYQLKEKYFLKRIDQNPFTKELGYFSLLNENIISSELLNLFFQKKLVSRYYFNYKNQAVLSTHLPFNTTYHLDLNSDYQTIKSNYNQNRVRNLTKSLNNKINITTSEEIDHLIELHKNNVQGKIHGHSDELYDILKSVYHQLKINSLAALYIAKTDSGEILSCALFIKSFERLIYYSGASSHNGKLLNSQTLLIDQLIRENLNTGLILDFNGGGLEGLNSFYSSFGAAAVKIPWLRKMPTLTNFLSKN